MPCEEKAQEGGLIMPFHLPILITILLYASTGLSFALIRGCDRDISALRRQSEEIRLGVARLKDDIGP